MLPDDKRQLVEDAAVSAVHALGIDWAPCHVEIKLTDRGPILMEVGARLGGGYITTELVPRATGIDMVEAAITLNIGRKPRLIPKHQPRGAAIRHIWPKPGKVVAIRGLDKARGVRDVKIIELFIKPGDVIQEIVSCGQRIGHVIAEGATAAEAIANAEAARDAIEIVTE